MVYEFGGSTISQYKIQENKLLYLHDKVVISSVSRGETRVIKYYTEKQIDNLIYVQTPKVLLFGSEYKKMMPQAKLLYIALLDKLKLSMSKNWKDEDGRYFVIMSIDYGAEMLGYSHSTLRRCKGELKKYNLIDEKRVGLNQPNRIYVGRLTYTEDDLYNIDGSRNVQDEQSEVLNMGDQDPRSVQYEHSEVLNLDTQECHLRATNNNKINNNEDKNIVNVNKSAVKNSIINDLYKEFSLKGMNKELFFRVLDQIEKQEREGIMINDFRSYFAQALYTALNRADIKRGLKERPKLAVNGVYYDWLNNGGETSDHTSSKLPVLLEIDDDDKLPF